MIHTNLPLRGAITPTQKFSMTLFLHFMFLSHLAGTLYSAYKSNWGDVIWGLIVVVWCVYVAQTCTHMPS